MDFPPDNSSIPDSEIWFELRRLLTAKPFASSPKLRKFLCFVVEETMAGRGARLTEYVLGVALLGRHAGYDPRLDSRVRVEAHRVRSALAEYFRDEGRNDPVIIRLDKGSYSPSFHLNSPASEPLPTSGEIS
ncbi:MAG TPA: hypothetical protein VN577_18435 [Terriglobales bacterium]|nr:hypothetical protein [Terriglobales bacterium]